MMDAIEFADAYVANEFAEKDYYAAHRRYLNQVAMANKSVYLNLSVAIAAGELIALIFKEQRARHKILESGQIVLRSAPYYSDPKNTKTRNQRLAIGAACALLVQFPYEHPDYGLSMEEKEQIEQMGLVR